MTKKPKQKAELATVKGNDIIVKDESNENICKICGSRWHITNVCPFDKSKCVICGNSGHYPIDCPFKEAYCKKCGDYGHLTNDCDIDEKVCDICGSYGHSANECQFKITKVSFDNQDTSYHYLINFLDETVTVEDDPDAEIIDSMFEIMAKAIWLIGFTRAYQRRQAEYEAKFPKMLLRPNRGSKSKYSEKEQLAAVVDWLLIKDRGSETEKDFLERRFGSDAGGLVVKVRTFQDWITKFEKAGKIMIR
jgi:hypothetical protein